MGQVTDAQILIVDPPRKGLDMVARWLAKEVRHTLCRRMLTYAHGYPSLLSLSVSLARWLAEEVRHTLC
jgi:hypothetical protein